MKKIIFMFPGVGSHHMGMGRFFYDNFKIARETFEEASDVLKVDLMRLCFSEESKKELEKLENAQTLLVTASIVTYRVYMEEVGIAPLYCLGHSLGEYSAMCAAGVIRFPDALKIVRHRGIILNRVASSMDGMMAWVINLDVKITEKVCEESSKQGNEIFVSAYDSPVQSSVSGLKDSVIRVGRKLEQEGAIVYPLQLRGPFHCPLMKEAADVMETRLRRFNFCDTHFPVIANQNAKPYDGIESIIRNLSLQLIRPIYWKNSISYLVEQGIEAAIEMGPDKVLKHLMKNNTDAISTYSLETRKDLDMIKDNI